MLILARAQEVEKRPVPVQDARQGGILDVARVEPTDEDELVRARLQFPAAALVKAATNWTIGAISRCASLAESVDRIT